MKIYLASTYSRRLEMEGYAANLRSLGHEVTSHWHTGVHETRPNIDAEHTRQAAARWAAEDLRDIAGADTLILTAERDGYRRGGCMTEFGYALARDLSLYVVGPRDNVFACLPQVAHYPDWEALLDDWLTEAEIRRQVQL